MECLVSLHHISILLPPNTIRLTAGSFCLQQIGTNQIKKFKVELLKRSKDYEDIAAWIIFWTHPLGDLVQLLRGGKPLLLSSAGMDAFRDAGGCLNVRGLFDPLVCIPLYS